MHLHALVPVHVGAGLRREADGAGVVAQGHGALRLPHGDVVVRSGMVVKRVDPSAGRRLLTYYYYSKIIN